MVVCCVAQEYRGRARMGAYRFKRKNNYKNSFLAHAQKSTIVKNFLYHQYYKTIIASFTNS